MHDPLNVVIASVVCASPSVLSAARALGLEHVLGAGARPMSAMCPASHLMRA